MTITVVTTAAEFNTATAAAVAGDIIKVASGTYSNWTMTVPASGAAGNKILIQPEIANGVTFTTTSKLVVTGSYIKISDFNFSNATGINVDISGGSFNQLTLCDFNTCGNPADLHQAIIRMQLGASDNEIDHNTMDVNQSVGIQVKVPANTTDPMPYRNWIHHNTISNVPNLPGQGQEAIQLGQTDEGAPNELYCLVEYNTFTACEGDAELISIKTSKAMVRYNRASDCKANFSLRQGHGNTLDSNVNLRSGEHGLVVTGADQTVINNFIDKASLSGILIAVGSNRYDAATNCLVAHNTVINSAIPMEFSLRDPVMIDLPSGNKIINNILNGNTGSNLAIGLHDNNAQTTLAACLAANLVDHNLMTGSVSTFNTGSQINYSGTETLDLTDPYVPKLKAADILAHDRGLAGYGASNDIVGSSRTGSSAPPDIGAFELAAVPLSQLTTSTCRRRRRQ